MWGGYFSSKNELTGNRADAGIKTSRFNKEKWFKLAVYAPFRISHYCCNVMKKQPAAMYHSESKRVPYIGTMTEESQLRKQAWLRHGCNAFHSKKQTSSPLSFWTEQDILQYIQRFNLKIAQVYGDIIPAKKDGQMMMEMGENTLYTTTGCMRTGCVFCGFGAHLENGETRFQMLKKTHPQLYQYCIDGGEWIENPDYDPSLSNEPDEIGWIDWNPPKLWIPNKNGLGMGKVFDIGNELYEKEMWRY